MTRYCLQLARNVIIRSVRAPFKAAVRLGRNTSGAVAMQFAVIAVPVLGLAGGALDYANMARIHTTLQQAADASAVAAVAIDSPAAIKARSMTTNGTISAGATDGQSVFNANIAGVSNYYNVAFTGTVTKTGLVLASNFSYSASIPTSFLGLFGISTWQLSGTSKATSNLSPYIDFYMLLDNTPSMGIAATQTGINQMVTLTSAGTSSYMQSNSACAFACHDLSQAPNDYYNLAKNNSIKMRIDVVREATQSLTSTATSAETVASQFRMAVYTFGATAATAGLTAVAPLNSNLTTVNTQANAVDVMSIPYNNYNNDQQTDFDTVLTQMNLSLPTPGDGGTSSTPQEVLFFVTDGVADAYYPLTCSQSSPGGGRCMEPLNVANCTAIKNRGIKIAVLYTTYYPLTTNSWYNSWIAPFSSSISTNLQQCASSGLYFEVSPTQGITEAMTALFNLALQQVRITQ